MALRGTFIYVLLPPEICAPQEILSLIQSIHYQSMQSHACVTFDTVPAVPVAYVYWLYRVYEFVYVGATAAA